MPGASIDLHGELLNPAGTCTGGTGQIRYDYTGPCDLGAGIPCTTMHDLQPGSWVHRIRVTVADSDLQEQAQRRVLVAGAPPEVRNALDWTIYPRTFVVANKDDVGLGSLRSQLDAAEAYTRDTPDKPALVTFAFSRDAVPGTIALTRGPCEPEPSRHAALCFTGSRVVVDGLDQNGLPGAVVWSVDTRDLSVLRLYGADNVFRGIVFDGTQETAPTSQLDTITITGGDAHGNRIEQSVVRGPTGGDAVSVEATANNNVIIDSELTRAADRGMKINAGGATIVGSCVHDNEDGGILATFGGAIAAVENVIQRNPGPKNGLTILSTTDVTSKATTQGNVIRFHDRRGVTISDNAEASLNDDYIANNTIKGVVVTRDVVCPNQTTKPPSARLHGVGVVCNGDGTPDTAGAVTFAAAYCITHPACPAPHDCTPPVPASCTPTTCHYPAPVVSYGTAEEPGLNAFTANQESNFRVDGIATTIPAQGNQWEACPNGSPCDGRPISPSNALVDLGTVPDPRGANDLHLTRVSPPRPRAGDVVRVYGETFDAMFNPPARGEYLITAGRRKTQMKWSQKVIVR